MTTVVNLHKYKHTLYIGRPSKFGNPFIIGKDGNREEVLAKYREWLDTTELLNYFTYRELKDQILGCYCKPLECHGDILAERVNDYWSKHAA